MVTGGHGDGAGAGDLSREKVLESWKVSCERLGVERVRTLYCHRPDPGTGLEETAGVFDELYKKGAFEHVSFEFSLDYLGSANSWTSYSIL